LKYTKITILFYFILFKNNLFQEVILTNLDKYSKVFIKTFSINKLKLKKLKYMSISGWDSVGHMTLVGAIEDIFKITMDMDDIIDLDSFEKGKKILKKYKITI